jgi:non-heme chloroperoxidase
VALLETSLELPGGLTVPYVEQGDRSGTPLVLLHAVADSWHSFELVLPHLPNSIHAFAFSQRGHGDASRPSEGYRSQEFAADLASFMDAVGLNAAVIAGGSSGGFVARRFAIDRPERTLGLVLLGSPGSLGDKPPVRAMFEATIAPMTDPIDPTFVREFAASTLAQPVPPAFLDTIVEENLKVPSRVWKATMQGLLEDDGAKELDEIRAPTLILWGDRDSILSRDEQESMAHSIPNARLVVYEGAGHALYWEEPDRVAADLVAFIGESVA